MKKLQVITVLLAGFVAMPTFAQSAQDMEVLAPHLKSIDTMPSKEALDEAFESPAVVLMTAARDVKLSGYERVRAITFLSLFPSPQAQVFLGSLLNDPDAEIRGMAVYTLARTFGTIPNDQTFEIIEKALKDPEISVRSWALRGLRHVHGPRPESLLALLKANAEGPGKSRKVRNP